MVTRRWIRGADKGTRTLDKGLGATSFNFIAPIHWRILVGHTGWNSTLEGICAGVTMITWPSFSKQFMNEKLLVQILKVGVRVGVEVAVQMGEEEFGVLVKREDVKEALESLMDEGEEGEDRGKRARNFAK